MTKKRLGIILGIIAVLIAGVVLMYNFGWRLWGFSACVSPEIYVTYHYEIKEDCVEILFDKNGFHNNGRTLGYITEEKDGVLKTGTKYADTVNGGIVIFKNKVSIHLAENGIIKTIIGDAHIKSTWEVIN